MNTPITRTVPGAVRECDVPVPLCSAFRLLSSLSYSRALLFAVARATQVCTRNRTSPAAIEGPPSSHNPATRPLWRSSRHVRDSPPDVAECHRVVVRRHTCSSPVTRRPTRATQARVAPGVHVCQPAPKAPSRESHETRNRPEDFLMVAQSTPPQARFATACYGLIVCVCYLFVKFCVTFLMMMMN